jgi:hypothetical protein
MARGLDDVVNLSHRYTLATDTLGDIDLSQSFHPISGHACGRFVAFGIRVPTQKNQTHMAKIRQRHGEPMVSLRAAGHAAKAPPSIIF